MYVLTAKAYELIYNTCVPYYSIQIKTTSNVLHTGFFATDQSNLLRLQGVTQDLVDDLNNKG